MKEGPDIAQLGALIGDPARANMLTALMTGKALTATELATEAGVSLQTASAHLRKLETAALLRQRKQGRHRYFALADDDVGAVLEAMMGLAAKRGLMRARIGPRDADLRHARVCYAHLAGDLGVFVYDNMAARGLIETADEHASLTQSGHDFLVGFGIDMGALAARKPLCKPCLDWSSRRNHLAGPVGRALLARMLDLGWARRVPGSRVLDFGAAGEASLRAAFAPSERETAR